MQKEYQILKYKIRYSFILINSLNSNTNFSFYFLIVFNIESD